ncbi:MAG: PIN domain-containing protein [Polyangia bacterium]|nr:PIN domain-containing protein [Polyangia bacterium]
MSLFVDTCVWSLALRRDSPPEEPAVLRLGAALKKGEELYSTGIVLQELLQGFSGPKDMDTILERFASLPLLVPTREDHIEAARLRNQCRKSGLQLGTIDALIAQLCLRYDLELLTTDQDFVRLSRLAPLGLAR